MNVGSYIGDKTDNRSIAGVGFAPDYVIIRPEASASNQNSSHKSAATGRTTDLTMDFYASDNDTDEIQALEADGFQVGSDNQVNQNGKTYYWMAFSGPGP